MKKYYVHHNGHSWFVKSEELFLQQRGNTEKWGENWKPITAISTEDARIKAERTLGND